MSKASVGVGAESHSKQEALAGRRELDPHSKGGPHVLWDWLTFDCRLRDTTLCGDRLCLSRIYLYSLKDPGHPGLPIPETPGC